MNPMANVPAAAKGVAGTGRGRPNWQMKEPG